MSSTQAVLRLRLTDRSTLNTMEEYETVLSESGIINSMLVILVSKISPEFENTLMSIKASHSKPLKTIQDRPHVN